MRQCEYRDPKQGRCEAVTSEDKPYCSNHVSLHPYVVDVSEQIAEMEGEVERIRRRGLMGADPFGLLAEELMVKLESDHMGVVTVSKISRELCQDKGVVGAVFLALQRVGRVILSRTARGGIRVESMAGPTELRRLISSDEWRRPNRNKKREGAGEVEEGRENSR